jgi:hypothetical protein
MGRELATYMAAGTVLSDEDRTNATYVLESDDFPRRM